jgi:hypothetical protein
MRAYVEGIGLLGPGLRDWHAARAVLSGDVPYAPARTAIPASELLPPAERRRAGIPVKLALAIGREAFLAAGRDAAATPTVFTSSSADGEILHQLCEVLATPEREVSPTKFMNSVHNAAAGYWSIATHSREPSTSLCCYDWSFAAGLLETACQVVVNRKAAALIAYDEPYPEPLHSARPIGCEFGVALVLGPEKGVAALDVEFGPGTETRLDDAQLENVRLGNPAARSLPLLAALARRARADVTLQYGTAASLRVRVEPC